MPRSSNHFEENVHTYLVWLKDTETEEDAREGLGYSPEFAAVGIAQRDHNVSHSVPSWPAVYVVKSVDSGKVWEVLVEQHVTTMFHAAASMRVVP